MCSKCTPPARIQMISDCRATGHRRLDNVLFKVNPSLRQAFAGHRCHKSLFRTRIVAEHPKFYSLQVHLDEAYTIRFMQFS